MFDDQTYRLFSVKSNRSNVYVTRLAPSPTGALHLGNARTFLLAWLRARAAGGRVILRVEDLDHPKVKPAAVAEIYADLRWLGLDWDEGDDCPTGNAPYAQSKRLPLYREALTKLRGDLYPCVCSRADIENAQLAPHAGEELFYPNTCRDKKIPPAQINDKTAWRFIAPAGEREFIDNFRGRERADLQQFSGDFVVARGATPAYQLACVVDDAAMGVTEVIRGDDLALSTFRQLALYDALNLSPPQFLHLPLLVGADGRRLAKRHGDTRLATLRQAGISPQKVVGYLARISGLSAGQPATPAALIAGFDLAKIPRGAVTVADANGGFFL
ncbi:MAG: tRNA glutamyl-Q(34) synthetase GluQRS [Planctomycetota bacterium]|jgi:glutamyl-tRNA synthetase|nr:tRNA glutamyl-Q(34) synthetase GluQRS [Planctomycetota bacterium]